MRKAILNSECFIDSFCRETAISRLQRDLTDGTVLKKSGTHWARDDDLNQFFAQRLGQNDLNEPVIHKALDATGPWLPKQSKPSFDEKASINLMNC